MAPAIRNANRPAIRANRFADYFHNVRAIRANRLKPAIRNFEPHETRFAKRGFSGWLKGGVWMGGGCLKSL